MNFTNEILQYRNNRKAREGDPYLNFINSSLECLNAAEYLIETKYDEIKYAHLLERSIVITYISSIESYFKDMLTGIFQICSQEAISKVYKHLHPNKYDIIELVDIYENEIHPCELIVNNLSFQNISIIDRTFSKIIEKPFWSSLNGLALRRQNTPESELHYDSSSLNCLDTIFQLRHELVHDPAKKGFINENFTIKMDKSFGCVMFANIILNKYIITNTSK